LKDGNGGDPEGAEETRSQADGSWDRGRGSYPEEQGRTRVDPAGRWSLVKLKG